MFLARRPSPDAIDRWLVRQAAAALPPPILDAGYRVDHHRVRVGDDAGCFARSRAALTRWDHFHLGWVDVVPAAPPIRVGVTVGVLVRHLGFWSLNASRIVTVIDEPDCFGFGYRTLADHAVDGDECFLVERAGADIVYDLVARSRPRHPLAWVGYPLGRQVQRRFARDSTAAMAAAVRF